MTIKIKNNDMTSSKEILEQMLEARPLPLGRTEFHEWSDRIISGAMVAGGEDDLEAFIDSQKFMLASMILQLGPTESHKSDAYFIHALRKAAANQVADTIGKELREALKVRLAAKEAKEVEDALS